VAASVLAWGLELWANTMFGTPVSPYLPGFAAVIASAGWAGFGPGLLATALVGAWCAALEYLEHRHSIPAQIFRGALFLAEGVLLSAGSGRLRRARAQAARGEDWHRRLVDTSGEGIWVADADGKIVYANPRIAEILGTEPENVAGRKMDEFFFPEDLSVERIRFRNSRNGHKEQFDRRLRRANGTEAWVLACANPFSGDGGALQGVLSMMTDITERKRAEHALRRSEERFRGLFENVLEGVYQSTPDGRIIAANPMLLKMLGMASESEMNDVNIAKDLYVDPGVRSRLLERLEREGSFQNVEYELRARDGQILCVQENARVVRDEEGKVLYYEGTLTDMTARKSIEEQLRQAQKMEALGRLAGGVAHDFSNILTIVSGYARLVVEDVAPAHPARSSAEQLLKAAESASGLTEQLLSFSRRQTELPDAADLNQVVRRSEAALRRTVEARAGQLMLTIAGEPAPVHADAGHIEQIVMNLAINARDTMPAGSALEVKTEVFEVDASFCRHYPDARPGLYASISVRVAGANEETIPEPASMRTAGFGVSTTQAIVAQYGGFMVVDIVAGRGAIFSVYLPRADESRDVRRADLMEAAARRNPQGTILLVDEEPLVRELSRDMIERQGYRVLLATDAWEAEQIVRRGSAPDLVITNLKLAQVSGPELARRLRAACPDLKVLFVSGQEQGKEAGAEAGGIALGDTLLEKPFSADLLGRKIRQLLGHS